MRIFVVGDSVTGTGPSNVTKYYIKNLPKGTLFQKRKSKIARVPELFINTIMSDVILFSGYSKQNILGMKFAQAFGRKTAYLMHGCVEYENEINLEPSKEMCEVERKTIRMTDRVFAVSPSFAKWLKENYKEDADKIDYVTNAIDDSLLERYKDNKYNAKDKRDIHNVMSIGGGMPRKRIKNICKAVEQLRESFDPQLKLTVIGAEGADSDEINSYDFVDNRGLVSFSEATELLGRTGLFVQNSCFETFGLAPIEAIACGSSVLCSKEVGALCLVNNLAAEDVVNDCEDIDELAEKIRILLENPNNERLCKGIDWENNTWEIRSRTLIEKLSELVR